MGKRRLILIAVALVALIFGVTSALKSGDHALPKMAPQEIVDKMIKAIAKPASISGSVIWTSNLGDISTFAPTFRSSGDPLLALLAPGSGRIWVKDSRAKLELDETMGTVTIVNDGSNTSVYSPNKTKLADYSLSATNVFAFCRDRLAELASSGTATLSQQTSIAGRDCYSLTIAPKTADTLVEEVTIAVDGETFIPLEVEAISKATGRAVFSLEFNKVSFGPINDDAVTFDPLANSSSPESTSGGSTPGSVAASTTTVPAGTSVLGVPVGLAQASAAAGFLPLTAHTGYAALELSDVWVIPKQRIDLRTLLQVMQSTTAGSTGTTTTAAGVGGALLSNAELGPAIVQSYGQGFGTILLIEIQLPVSSLVELDKSLSAAKRFLKAKSVNHVNIFEFSTPAGFVGIWNNGGRLLMAVGSVPEANLVEFITSVR